jgi:hypothetical protein
MVEQFRVANITDGSVCSRDWDQKMHHCQYLCSRNVKSFLDACPCWREHSNKKKTQKNGCKIVSKSAFTFRFIVEQRRKALKKMKLIFHPTFSLRASRSNKHFLCREEQGEE